MSEQRSQGTQEKPPALAEYPVLQALLDGGATVTKSVEPPIRRVNANMAGYEQTYFVTVPGSKDGSATLVSAWEPAIKPEKEGDVGPRLGVLTDQGEMPVRDPEITAAVIDQLQQQVAEQS